MNLTKLNCPSCGAPISIPEDLTHINCASCGSFCSVERGEGYVALKVAEKLARAIEDSGRGTQEVIRESSQVTRTELQRLQIAQEISAAQSQLSNIQAEMRSLQRGAQNAVAAKQMKNLHFNEYQAMEKIRLLDAKYSAPSADDLPGGIAFAEKESLWIDGEINALTQSDAPQRLQIIQTLRARKEELNQTALQLKVRALKEQFPSFKIGTLPLTEREQAQAVLKILDKDEKTLRGKTVSPESKIVYQEIKQRQATLYSAWGNLELNRWNGMLSSQANPPVAAEIESLRAHQQRLEQDLAMLANAESNAVVQELQKKLECDRSRTQQQIQKIERQAEKARRRAEAPEEEVNLVDAFGAGFAALIAGLAGLFSGRGSTPAAQTGATPINMAASGMPPATYGAGLSATLNSPTPSRNIVVGALLGGLVSVMVFFLLAVLLSIPALPADGAVDNGGKMAGAVFFSLAAGIGMGAWAFFRYSAPQTVIRGFGKSSSFRFARRGLNTGWTNRTALRILVGFFSCLILWSCFIALAGYLTPPDGSAPTAVILIGLLLGPTLALILAQRTDLEP